MRNVEQYCGAVDTCSFLGLCVCVCVCPLLDGDLTRVSACLPPSDCWDRLQHPLLKKNSR